MDEACGGRANRQASALGNSVGVGSASFGFRKSAPDAIRFPDLKGVRTAVTHNWAHLAYGLCASLSALPFILTFLSARRKKEMGVVAAAQCNGLPGTIR